MGSQQKNEEVKQVLMEKGLKAEEHGRAESGVLPSIVPWSQQLLPAWSLCVCAQATVRLWSTIHKPIKAAAPSTASHPGVLTAAVHSALLFPIPAVAL